MSNEQSQRDAKAHPVDTLVMLACPFCGSKSHVTERVEGFRVECKNRKTTCPVNMRTHHTKYPAEAITLWNTRAI